MTEPTKKAKPKPKPKNQKRSRAGNDLQERFVSEYMIDKNARNAAIRAGFSAASAHVTAHRLLKKANVASEIARREAEIAQKCDVSVEKIMREYARIAFFDPGDFFNDDGTLRPISEIPEDARRAISSLDINKLRSVQGDDVRIEEIVRKIRTSSKVGCLDSLARIMGLMKDQVEATMPDLVSALDKARKRIHG